MDREVNLRGDILTVVIVAMQAMLTRRSGASDGPFPEADRRGYQKLYEARSTSALIPGIEGAHRGEIYTLAKLPLHSKMGIVRMHLRHIEDCTAATAREKHYSALAWFLRLKAQQECPGAGGAASGRPHCSTNRRRRAGAARS